MPPPNQPSYNLGYPSKLNGPPQSTPQQPWATPYSTSFPPTQGQPQPPTTDGRRPPQVVNYILHVKSSNFLIKFLIIPDWLPSYTKPITKPIPTDTPDGSDYQSNEHTLCHSIRIRQTMGNF